MCLADSDGNVMVFLEPLSRIDNAIQSQSFAKFFYKDKIGQSCLFAVDESKRMLAVYASTRVCHCSCLYHPLESNQSSTDAAPDLHI